MSAFQSTLKTNVFLTVEEIADHLNIRDDKILLNGIDAKKATGFVRITNNVFDAGDIAKVAGQNFEQSVDWPPGIDESASAISLKNAINLVLSGTVNASIDPSDPQKILLEASTEGIVGNGITLALIDNATANFVISGPTLTGGVDDVPQDPDTAKLRRNLERFMNVASAKAESIIETNILQRQFAEILDGNDSNFIVPSHWPILSVQKLFIDFNRIFGPGTEIDPLNFILIGTPDHRDPVNRVIGSHIALRDDDKITIVGRVFAGSILGSIKLEYTAGWGIDSDDVPPDLRFSVTQLVEYYFFQKENRDLSVLSKGVRGESYTRLTDGIPLEIVEGLEIFKNYSFGFHNQSQTNVFGI